MAQLGSAIASGVIGRRFKSCRPDHKDLRSVLRFFYLSDRRRKKKTVVSLSIYAACGSFTQLKGEAANRAAENYMTDNMMTLNEEKLWKKAAAFHGHECGGLMIGFKAALYAIRLLELEADENGTISEDEEVVCITENDACGVDAIQAILSCTAGKGNLLFRIRGKMAFNFYNRKTGKAVRLILREPENNDDRKERISRLYSVRDKDPADCFDVTDVHFQVPEPARKFRSIRCSRCGELTADHLIRLSGDEKLCLDCFTEYRRFE